MRVEFKSLLMAEGIICHLRSLSTEVNSNSPTAVEAVIQNNYVDIKRSISDPVHSALDSGTTEDNNSSNRSRSNTVAGDEVTGTGVVHAIKRRSSVSITSTPMNPIPQAAPGSNAAFGHTLENSIPLSIFPIQADKFAICFCGLPGRGKTFISRRLARYLYKHFPRK